MSLTYSMDTSELNRTLADLAIAAGKDADTIVRVESRLFAEQAMRRTPPKTQGQGRKAVERDIKKIIAGAPESLIRHAMNENGGSGDNIKLFTGDTEEPSIEWHRAQLTDDRLEEYHNSQRDRRGRIQSRARTTGGGRWIENKRVVVPERVRARYIKRKQQNVGRLKAGWIPAVRQFQGKVPKWVSRRHEAGARGTSQLRGAGTNAVTAIMTNSARGASELNQFMRDVLRIRLSAIKRKIRLINSGYAKDIAIGMRVRSRARRTS
jgi:hypothetical protein